MATLTPQQEAEIKALLAKGNAIGAAASQQTGVAYTPTPNVGASPAYTPSATVGNPANSYPLAQQAQQLGVQNVPQSLLQPQQSVAAAPPPTPIASPAPQPQGKNLAFTPSSNTYQSPQSSAPNLPGFQQANNQTQWLPQQPGQGGGLTAFAAALDQATGLAKQNRNALALGLMMPAQGTVAASDFNSILGNMNAASNEFSTGLVGKAMDAATPRYETQTIGNQIVQMAYDNTGKFIGSSPIAILPEQYNYDTMTLPNGDVYSIQTDSSGRPIGQQLVYQNPQTNQNTYDYQTGDDGAIYEYSYAPNGQMQGLKQVGQLPTQAVSKADDYTYKTTYQDGAGKQWFMGVKPDGTADNYELGGAATPPKPASAGSKPTAAEQKEDDRQEARQVLSASKGSDGYVNTETYVQAMNAWPGSPDDFFKEFPPGQYVNPDDPTVPLYIQDQMY